MQSLVKITKLFLAISFISTSLSALEINSYKTKDWGHGFCAKVLIYNASSKPERWDFSFHPKGRIDKIWSANYTQDKHSLITRVQGLEWNDIIKAKHTRTFGYCATIDAPHK
ncbi:hypothetical protein MNB_SV-13-1375 [hydrothermal vent metagenome]|uniref:CBM2 domain-containing protein n=1 Tax=hydrothermal vent metagenome TaxID=652676 RepID=A0A1W1C5K8_9ZZZZ